MLLASVAAIVAKFGFRDPKNRLKYCEVLGFIKFVFDSRF
jgi:hypothetical protein